MVWKNQGDVQECITCRPDASRRFAHLSPMRRIPPTPGSQQRLHRPLRASKHSHSEIPGRWQSGRRRIGLKEPPSIRQTGFRSRCFENSTSQDGRDLSFRCSSCGVHDWHQADRLRGFWEPWSTSDLTELQLASEPASATAKVWRRLVLNCVPPRPLVSVERVQLMFDDR